MKACQSSRMCRRRNVKILVVVAMVIGVSVAYTLYLTFQVNSEITARDILPDWKYTAIPLMEFDVTSESDYVDAFEDQLIRKKEIFHKVGQRQCKEKRNFVFIKTMKCATQTVTQVLRRFGYIRHLNFVLPRRKNIYVGWPYIPESIDYRPSNRSFNALVEHSIYNATAMSAMMPKDTAYFTIIREPFSQFKSAFHYFNVANISHVKGPDHISEYLNNLEKYETIYKSHEASPTRYCIPDGFSISKNLLSHCLGMQTGFPAGRPDISNDLEAVKRYIQFLDDRFEIVMLMEYFHESLVLLKRLMCWSLLDIVYLSSNIGNYSYKKLVPGQSSIEKIYRKWSSADYLLYDHFNKTFWRKVQEQGSDFPLEVEWFNKMQSNITRFCADKNRTREATLKILASAFSEELTVNGNFCYLQMVDLLTFLKTRHEREENWTEPPEDVNLPKRGC